MYVELNEAYRDNLEKQWKPVLEVEGLNDLKSASMRRDTAVILENTFKRMVKDGFDTRVLSQAINEAEGDTRFGNFAGNSAGAVKGETDGKYNNIGYPVNANQTQDWRASDQRLMLATLPLARRMFTQLLAHQLVGVQTMAGPTGYASVLRYVYGKDAAGRTDADGNTMYGKEMIFDAFDPSYSGASESVEVAEDTLSEAATAGWFGSASDPKKAAGAWVQDMESSTFTNASGLGGLARGSLKLEKQLLEAKTRKFATTFSIEDMEDLMAIQGLNVNEELVTVLGNEVKNEIDRELLQTIVLGTIGDARKAAMSFSTWDPTKADGTDQMKRLATLLTQIYVKSKKIQFNTKQGSANWLVASSEVGGYIERMGDYTLMNPDVDVDSSAIAYAGTLKKGAIKVYNDALTSIPYVLLGWKGATATQTGVVFCPYVPVQMLEGPDPDALGGKRILARSRYAVYNSLFGTERYYQYIQINNLEAVEYGDVVGKRAAKFVSISKDYDGAES